MQLVEIMKVFESAVKVVHPTKQANNDVRTLDNVKGVELTDECIVMWGSEYLI